MNKNLYFIIILLLSILFIVSCNSENELNDDGNELCYYNYETFKLSVVDNTLLFEDEHELFRCFDYLVESGYENFDAFEESINFFSFRRFYSYLEEKPKFYEDLYFTLLNPDGKIIVGDYLLQDCPEENNILAYKIVCDNNLDDLLIPDMIISRDQDVFRAIRGEVPLKSSGRDLCRTNSQEGTITDFRVDIKVKTQFNNGIIKFFKARISRPWCINCGLTMSVSNRECISSFCLLDEDGDNHAEQGLGDMYKTSKETKGTHAEIYFNVGFRLTDYRFYVDYYVAQEFPWFNQIYSGDISCGSSDQYY